jgi:hypothetical protein
VEKENIAGVSLSSVHGEIKLKMVTIPQKVNRPLRNM